MDFLVRFQHFRIALIKRRGHPQPLSFKRDESAFGYVKGERG